MHGIVTVGQHHSTLYDDTTATASHTSLGAVQLLFTKGTCPVYKMVKTIWTYLAN